MRQIDPEEPKSIRNPRRPDPEAGIATPGRNPTGLFHGWGPKLMLCALAIGAAGFANKPAIAAPQHVAVSACDTPDRGATLLSNPTPQMPSGVSERGTTVMRIDLSPSGHIEALAIAQSAGDMRLDFEAVRVAQASRYASASRNCNPVSDRVLYAVTFSD
jgi:TonB family protein